MSHLRSQCPHCGARIKHEEKHIGRTVNCPQCKRPFTIAAEEMADVVPPSRLMRAPSIEAPPMPPPVPPAIPEFLHGPMRHETQKPTVVFVQVPSAPTVQPVVRNVVTVHRDSTNGLGTAGFVTSLVGLFLTCGILSPIGLLFSAAALFKAPRGMAIAGFVLGAIGSWWLFAFGLAMLVAAFNISVAHTARDNANRPRDATPISKTPEVIAEAVPIKPKEPLTVQITESKERVEGAMHHVIIQLNNNTSRRIVRADVECSLYDVAGNEVESRIENALKATDRGLAPGASTEFKYLIGGWKGNAKIAQAKVFVRKLNYAD